MLRNIPPSLPTKQNGELKFTNLHVGTQMDVDGAQIGRAAKQNAKRISPYHEYFGKRERGRSGVAKTGLRGNVH